MGPPVVVHLQATPLLRIVFGASRGESHGTTWHASLASCADPLRPVEHYTLYQNGVGSGLRLETSG